MLLETYDIAMDPRSLHLIAGALLGLMFGIAAQVSRFCLRRAVAGAPNERASASVVWATALLVAALSFVGARAVGLISIEDHRLFSSDLPVVAIALGGLLFGAGMVLTRGCASRLTVLSATGNLRALTVLAVFAVVAHATIKGVFAPLRTWLGGFTVDQPFSELSETSIALGVAVVALAIIATRQARPPLLHVVLGALIGLVAVGGWVVTSVLLFDEFDPLPVQSAAFTLPWSDSLFWVIASSAIPAGFGVGFVGGTLAGSFLSAATRGELALQSFTSPQETLRYLAGGGLMGLGGVLAGGCTVGAGLSGAAAGSVAAILALLAIIGGAAMTSRLLQTEARGTAVPAE